MQAFRSFSKGRHKVRFEAFNGDWLVLLEVPRQGWIIKLHVVGKGQALRPVCQRWCFCPYVKEYLAAGYALEQMWGPEMRAELSF